MRKYESSITYHLKAMAKLQVIADKQERQTNGQDKSYMPLIYGGGGIKIDYEWIENVRKGKQEDHDGPISLT